ncbi:MAG: DUF177 domain-containing protein [Lentisphaeria bacterium]|nr:DUF177 domain-containing protein [Lentisphaeria bacterium]
MIMFSVSAVIKAPVTLCGREKPEFLELDAGDDAVEVVSDITYELTGSAVSGGVLISGSAEVTIAGTCGRCLQPVRQVVKTEDLKLFFEVEDYQEELDISEDIRAEVLLAFPMNMLCSCDCAGLCPECGTDLNQGECECSRKKQGDMRWSALDGLKL